jgi:hypothetical protein
MKIILYIIITATLLIPTFAQALNVPWNRPSAGIIHPLYINDKVGIGTTTPYANLSIAGGITASDTSLAINNMFRFRGDGVLHWGTNGNSGLLSWDTGKAIVGARSGNDLALYSNAIQNATLTSGGNFGIGTTTPGSMLHLFGTTAGIRVDSNVATNAASDVLIAGSIAGFRTDDFAKIQVQRGASLGQGWNFLVNNNAGTASEAMRITEAGNVGIGTTTPVGNLDVSGSTGIFTRNSAGGRIVFDDTDVASASTPMNYITGSDGALQFGAANRASTGLTTGSSEYMRISSTGNVGIGTTTADRALAVSADNFSQLHVFGTGSTQAGGIRAYNNTGAAFTSIETMGSASVAGPTAGDSVIYSTNNLQFGTGGARTARMFITTAGNVGIGSTTPGAKLEVAGTGNVGIFGSNTHVNQYLMLRGGGTGSGYLGLDTSLNGGNGGYVLQSGTAKSLSFVTNSDTFGAQTAAMTIAQAGNVGIGTTSPWAPLSVTGGSGLTAPTMVLKGGSASGAFLRFEHATNATGWTIGSGQTANSDFIIRDNLNGTRVLVNSSGNVGIGSTTPWAMLSITETGTDPAFCVEDTASPDITPFCIDANGSVGVGTAAPNSKFEISATGGVVPRITSTDGGGDAMQRFYSGSTFKGSVGWNQANDIIGIFGAASSATPVISVTSGARVGVGTTTPTGALHVNNTSLSQLVLSNTSAGTNMKDWRFNAGASTFFIGTLSDATTASGDSAITIGRETSSNDVDYIEFATNNDVNKVRFTNDGNLGIGTTTPDRKLMVSGGTAGSNTGIFAIQQSTSAAVNSGASVEFSGRNGSAVMTDMASIGTLLRDGTNNLETSDLAFSLKSSGTLAERMRITGAGLLGIGTTTPWKTLSVTGEMVVTATSTLSSIVLPSTGTNPTVGNATLVAGTVTVNTGAAKSTSYLILTEKTAGGTPGTVTYTVTGGSFTITSSNALDTSTYTWLLIN